MQKYLIEMILPDSLDSSEILEALQSLATELSEDECSEDDLTEIENAVSIQAVDDDPIPTMDSTLDS